MLKSSIVFFLFHFVFLYFTDEAATDGMASETFDAKIIACTFHRNPKILWIKILIEYLDFDFAIIYVAVQIAKIKD